MARDGHGHSLPGTRADHVAGRRATQVVEQLVGDPGTLAAGGPGLAEVPHGGAVTMEHQGGDADVAVFSSPRRPDRRRSTSGR